MQFLGGNEKTFTLLLTAVLVISLILFMLQFSQISKIV